MFRAAYNQHKTPMIQINIKNIPMYVITKPIIYVINVCGYEKHFQLRLKMSLSAQRLQHKFLELLSHTYILIYIFIFYTCRMLIIACVDYYYVILPYQQPFALFFGFFSHDVVSPLAKFSACQVLELVTDGSEQRHFLKKNYPV